MVAQLTILLPAHNEAITIGTLLDEIVREIVISHEVLVIDNASTDDTASIALEKGAAVCFVDAKGKGNAVREALRDITTPYVIMMNSDGTYPPAYSHLIYELLGYGHKVVLGCRTFYDKGSMSILNGLGNWALSLGASILYRKRVYDLCSGMWGFNTEVLKSFTLTSTGFTLEADLYINTIRGKHKLVQIPIGYRARPDNSHTKLKLLDGFKIGWFLCSRKFGKTL
jgi:dolichol-phosphate mannosyltransferase